jgi:hypothetical protein
MSRRRSLSPSKREAIYQREAFTAYAAGRGRLPICNLCDAPVDGRCEAWEVSHGPVAHTFGGKRVGVAHVDCNRQDGRKVSSDAAKCDRVRQRFIGARGPGLGRHPMDGGRCSPLRKTLRHGVVARLSIAERHAITMAKRAILTDQPEA